ncbi:transposase, partial [Shigella flexneri]
AFSSGAGRTSDGNGSHASTLKSPSYTKSVSWQHYPAPVSPAAHFLPNGCGAPRQYNGGYGRCCRSCTGPAGETATP